MVHLVTSLLIANCNSSSANRFPMHIRVPWPNWRKAKGFIWGKFNLKLVIFKKNENNFYQTVYSFVTLSLSSIQRSGKNCSGFGKSSGSFPRSIADHMMNVPAGML